MGWPNDKGLASAAPQLIRITGGSGEGANGSYFLVIKDGPPVEAAVLGFEDATGGCANVGDHGVAGFADDGGGAVAVDAEEAEGEGGEGLGGGKGGKKEEEKKEEVAHGFLVFLEGKVGNFGRLSAVKTLKFISQSPIMVRIGLNARLMI